MKLKHYIRQILLIAIGLGLYNYSHAQSFPVDSVKADSLDKKASPQAESFAGQYDVGDLARAIFRPRQKPDSLRKRSGITIIPNVAANPSIGAQLGIKAVAGVRLGNDPNTL